MEIYSKRNSLCGYSKWLSVLQIPIEHVRPGVNPQINNQRTSIFSKEDRLPSNLWSQVFDEDLSTVLNSQVLQGFRVFGLFSSGFKPYRQPFRLWSLWDLLVDGKLQVGDGGVRCYVTFSVGFRVFSVVNFNLKWKFPRRNRRKWIFITKLQDFPQTLLTSIFSHFFLDFPAKF